MDDDFRIFKKFKQVVVWGFPLHSHTHSYIHGAWVKTFQWLKIPVFWFHDKEYPTEFDYENTCFITEGWADDNIPVRPSSTYFVHIAKNPDKYLSKGARLIEIRYNVLEIHDFNYDYVLPTNAKQISNETLYEVVLDDSAVAKRRGRPVKVAPYEVAYMMWATDLLPHEFNMEDAEASHERILHYVGSLGGDHPVLKFKQCAEKEGIPFLLHDPWSNPVSYEENIRLMKQSYCAPDFRSKGCPQKRAEYGPMNGTNHLEIGYIPCRVFKAISYGHTGITNSKRVKQFMGDFVEYAENPEDVLPIVERRKGDVEWRKACMKHVQMHHTFLQRARDLARIIALTSPRTLPLFKTPLGSFHVLPNDEAFYGCLSKGQAWEQDLVQRVLDFIPSKGTILDVGGHIGTHSIPYSMYRPESHVYTFEPQAMIRSILEMNKAANSIKNMTIMPVGAGHVNRTTRLAFDFTSDGYNPTLTVDYDSKISQNFGGLGITNDPRGEVIQIKTIDSFDFPSVIFMKIDVEGAETLAVYGAQNTIKKYKPVLLIEQSDKDISSLYKEDCEDLSRFHVTDFLLSLGYTKTDLGTCNYLYTPVESPVEISLEQHEQTIFSESGEDGILVELFRMFKETNKFYVEFGAENGTQCNTRFLRERKGFSGILFDSTYENHGIQLYKHMITVDNVIGLFKQYKVPKEFDLLSVDIDSHDFYVLEKILSEYIPRIFVCEYNATHLPDEDKIVLLDTTHFEGNYFGASILAFYKLGRKYQYSLVYANKKGVNLFFVKDSVLSKSNYVIQHTNNVSAIYQTPKYGKGPNGGHAQDPNNTPYTNTGDVWNKQTNPVTCVTAFYNIGRETVDGRSLQDYKRWVLQTVTSIHAPFVVFLDESLGWKEELCKAAKAPLHVIETPLGEVPMAPYKEHIRRVLESQDFKRIQKHPQDITNRLPEYCMIQYSKFGWLEQAILKNPFKSTQFAWMDAGLSRFFDPSQIYQFQTAPANSFVLQADMNHPLLPTITHDTYIGTNECIFKGGLWIVEPYAFKRVQTEVMRIFFEEMLQKNRIDNEQIALALAYKHIPEAFTCIQASTPIQPFFDTAFKKQEGTNEGRRADVGIIEKKERAQTKSTVVTCYYQIPSKHSHANYEAWIQNFMKLDMNVVVFGNTESLTFLKQRYPESPTRIYKQREFRDFTSATLDWSHDEQRNREPKGGHSAQLFQIWSEKLHFVADVISTNPFQSDSFVWMDIGCVRTSSILPRMKGFPNLHGDLDRVQILQMKPWTSDDAEKAKVVNHTQFLNRPTMGGTMWGGGPEALLAFREKYMDILREADRLEVFKGEDQDMYAYCVLRNPELFKIHRPLENDYDEWFSLHLLWSEAPPLRIVLVGPGLMPIPPTGWGACEILIWDMAVCLKKQGHEVTILNTKDMSQILSHVQQHTPDFVHIQYDDYAYMAPLLSPYAKAVAITSHYGYLDQPGRWGPYANTFRCCIGHTEPNIYHLALSDSIRKIYLKHGVSANRVFVTPNGADESLFRYTETPAYPERSIVVGKMEVRKGQYKLMNTEDVWFAGNKSDGSFDYRHPRWLGEWTKPVLYNSLTDYGNLVLLSDGEADPLVVKEALVAGLGVVVSEWAAANLDKHPFLTVVEASKLDDTAYVAQKIKENREYSVTHRKEIKLYSQKHTWTHRTTEYASLVRSIIHPLKLSLCIPTMKRWSFLKDTLPKYLENPMIDEIIITDETGEDAEQIAIHLKSPKLKVHVNERCLGAFLNKRTAVRLATNSFVCLMDSDNYAPPSYFEAFRQYVKGQPDPTTIYCPGRWNPAPGNPGMDFTAFQAIPITNANRKDLFPLGLESFFNDGNYIVSKELYEKAEATGSYKQYETNCLAADVIFQNHLLFEQGATLLIVPGMSYDHAVHEGSYWKTTSNKFDYSVFQNMYK